MNQDGDESNMQTKPVFHLFIPNLIQSLSSWHQDFLFDVEATHLSILLSKYEKKHYPNVTSISRSFFKALDFDNEELPIAQYRHQVQTSSKLESLICADPVHLEVGMNDVTLTDKISDLSNDEAMELIEVLNEHFSQDGLKFIFGSNDCWYVSFPKDEVVQSHDIDSVLLKNIIDKPTKSQQRNWQVIQNETQMLLHSSDINSQREIAGLKPVNSLWFWGAGKPQEISHQFDFVYSRSDQRSKLQGETFARAAKCQWKELPAQLEILLNQNDVKSHAFLLDQLFMPALENKLDDFQSELENIDTNIIKPLLNAWEKNKVDIIIDCCDGNTFMPQRIPIWKFWSKPIKLRELS